MTDEKKESSRTVTVMVLLILAMLIGIITRWDYIQSEVGTVIKNMFPAKVEKMK